MKAKFFAAALSFSILTLPSFANPSPSLETKQIMKKINLNTASADLLIGSFKGIGKKRAGAIVAYRQKHGNFKSIADLAGVQGLGPSFVNHHLPELQAVFVLE